MITDEQTIREMDFQEACDVFLAAEHWFQRINAHPGKVSDPHVNLRWWVALEEVFEKEKVVQRLFVGPHPTLEQNKLYAKFREVLVQGNKSKMKANA